MADTLTRLDRPALRGESPTARLDASFADLLGQLRRAGRLTQRDLASRIGYSISQVRKFEQGARLPTDDAFEALATTLQLSGDERDALWTALLGARRTEGGETGHADAPGATDSHRAADLVARLLTMAEQRLPFSRNWVIATVGLVVVLLATLICLTIALIVVTLRREGPPTAPAPAAVTAAPLGVWLAPDDGQYVGDRVPISLRAFPAHPGDPPIDHVIVTAWWPGLSHGVTVCSLWTPRRQDVYTCSWVVAASGVPAGIVKLGFTVSDSAGHSTEARDDVHLLVYKPGFASGGATP